MSHISIKNQDKAAVLAALFNGSRQQGMGFLNSAGRDDMTVEKARTFISPEGQGVDDIVQHFGPDNIRDKSRDKPRISFDYLLGRVMKVDLTDDTFDPRLYDRDNGSGAARRALEAAGLVGPDPVGWVLEKTERGYNKVVPIFEAEAQANYDPNNWFPTYEAASDAAYAK